MIVSAAVNLSTGFADMSAAVLSLISPDALLLRANLCLDQFLALKH